MNHFFTADYHFQHSKIIDLAHRPFKTIDDMNGTIIRNHNMVVKPNDIVYHIGDYLFHGGSQGGNYKSEDFDSKLNGKIIHINGNHDNKNNLKNIIQSMTIVYGGYNIFLVHDPKFANFSYKINLIGHVHCLSEDTEILTNNGWKTHYNIKKTDMIIALNKHNKLLEPTTINEIIKKEVKNQKIFKYENKNGRINFAVTRKHRMYLQKNNSKQDYKIVKINKIEKLKNSNFKTFISGDMYRRGVDLSDDEIRLIVWIVTDGNIFFCRKTPFIRFKLSKPKKIKKLEELLQKLNIAFSKNICKKTNYQNLIPYRINLLKFNSRILSYFSNKKTLPIKFRNLSKKQVEVLIETYYQTDGTKYNDTTGQISTSKKEEADLLQEILVTNGYSCSSSHRKFLHKNTNYVLSIVKNRKEVYINTRLLKTELYSGVVWCVNTNLDTIITRRNGKTIIVGNSAFKIKKLKGSYLVNVGVDMWNFRPIKINEILKEISIYDRNCREQKGI